MFRAVILHRRPARAEPAPSPDTSALLARSPVRSKASRPGPCPKLRLPTTATQIPCAGHCRANRLRCREYKTHRLHSWFRSCLAKRLVTMSKALGHIQSPIVIFSQLNSNMLEISWAFGAQVNNDIDDCAARATHQFCFCGGWKLEVHAADCALFVIEARYCPAR